MGNHLPFAERKTPWRGVLDLATGCYPAFLFGGELGRWLPVFHFHEATPEGLGPYLDYLASNGYRTVTSEAVAAYVRRGLHPGPRSVVLCFDDAWASLWTVAAPLLHRHGFQAVTYVHPGRVSEAADVRATLDSAAGAPAGVDASDVPFATWPELRALHAAGTIDIQAHTHWHAMIPCSPDIVDFVTPQTPPRHPHLYPRVMTDSGERFLSPDDLGAPLYPERSRYSDALRFEHPAAFEACTRHVRENGGAAFFEREDWIDALLDVVRASGPGRHEPPAGRDAAILADLRSARETLNARLGSDTVRHMCFPWAVSGRAAVRAAEQAGYVTAFSDRVFGGRGVRPGDPPYQLMRLKHQHIYALPGAGRMTLWRKLPPGSRRSRAVPAPAAAAAGNGKAGEAW